MHELQQPTGGARRIVERSLQVVIAEGAQLIVKCWAQHRAQVPAFGHAQVGLQVFQLGVVRAHSNVGAELVDSA
jgi:hypothetical protein